MRRATYLPLRPSEWAKKFHSVIDGDPNVLGSGDSEARGAMQKARTAKLDVLTDYLLYQWAMTRGPWLPGISDALTHARDVRRAARRAVREAKKHRRKRRAAMFRRREFDALLRFSATVVRLSKAESLEESLKRVLSLPAPVPKPMSRNFFLVCLYEAAAPYNTKFTWAEIATLAQIASRAAGCERFPDERELRRYASRPGMRKLARQWLTTFPPVVVALWHP